MRLPAADWRDVQDAARELKEQSHSRFAFSGDASRSLNVALVRNQSGEDLDQFDAVALRDPYITPDDNLVEWQRQVTFDCYIAEAEDVAESPHKVGILLEAIPDGAIGRACLVGVVPCYVDMLAEGDRYASLVEGETTLESGSSGPVELLWAEEGTGEVWATGKLVGAQVSPAESGSSPLCQVSTSGIYTTGQKLVWRNPSSLANQAQMELNTGSYVPAGATTTYLELPSAGYYRVDVEALLNRSSAYAGGTYRQLTLESGLLYTANTAFKILRVIGAAPDALAANLYQTLTGSMIVYVPTIGSLVSPGVYATSDPKIWANASPPRLSVTINHDATSGNVNLSSAHLAIQKL